ncbi:MAG: hypothetical protein A7316_03400 [Candidatus Altiarchaeales archaeon WOR_SM1_86-2]|nr:MAG: hypothetical protein A7316_03400 [Candidatus Altiarchaeales archaeon WOR_SM1_86-2]ODS41663.1 MAG: hypothetical protein A7315_00800 [Candidatus Altiarchaeales archaeon WOR_SM1_79]
MCKLCEKDVEVAGDTGDLIDFVHEIIKEINPQKIILYGGIAEDQSKSVDLMVVADIGDEEMEKTRNILTEHDIGASIYSRREFDTMVERQRPFVMRVLKEGMVVYERQS